MSEEEIATLKAQVAMMAEALQAMMQWIGPPPIDAWSYDSLREDAWQKATKALSSAPKVLWHGKARADISTDMTNVVAATDNPMTWIESEDIEATVRKRIGVGPWTPLPIQVEVYVVDRPRPPEQGQDSEEEESK